MRADSAAKGRRLFLATMRLGPCGIIATPIHNILIPTINKAVTPSAPHKTHNRGAHDKDPDSLSQPDRSFTTRESHRVPATWHCRGGYRSVEGSCSEQFIPGRPSRSVRVYTGDPSMPRDLYKVLMINPVLSVARSSSLF